MQKIIITAMVFIVSISPFFRGLFFDFEAYAALTLLAFLSILYFMIKLSKKETMHFNKWLLILGALLVSAYALSFIKAVNIRENIASLLQVMEYLMVSITLYDYYQGKEENFIFLLMYPAAITAFISAVLGLEATSGVFYLFNNVYLGVGSVFQYANTASIYYVIGLIFSVTIIQHTKSRIVKGLSAGAGSILLMSLIFSNSKGGYLIGFISILLLLVLQPKGNKLKTLGCLVGMGFPALFFTKPVSTLNGTSDYFALARLLVMCFLVSLVLNLIIELFFDLLFRVGPKIHVGLVLSITFVLIVAMIVFLRDRISISAIIPSSILSELNTFDIKSGSFTSRLQFSRDALKLIKDHWLFGLGGGGWAALYPSVQESFYISRAVHNHFLQIFVEAGILGFLSFSALMLISFYYMLQGLRASKDPNKKTYRIALTCSFLALIAHSAMDFDLSYVSMSLLLWTFVAGAAISDDSNSVVISGKATSQIILVIFSSILLSVNGLYTAASYYAEKGIAAKNASDYRQAWGYYETAYKMDPINSGYTFELTKTFNYFADHSTTPEKIQLWRSKAVLMAEKSVQLNPYIPENLRILTRTYLDTGIPEKAVISAEQTIKRQPLNPANYELLAEVYWKASEYYMKDGDIKRVQELLLLCSEIDQKTSVKLNKATQSYIEKAFGQLEQLD